VNQFLEEAEYFLKRGQYNEYHIPLSPTFRYQTLIAVYFSHETRYIPKDKYCPPTRNIQPLTRLHHVNGEVQEGYFYHERRTFNNPGQPQSILLTKTPEAENYSDWLTRLDYIHSCRYTEEGKRVRSILYFKLLETSYNFEDFVTHFDETKALLISDKERRNRIHTRYTYQINRVYRHKLIDKAIITRVRNRFAVNKILKAWRFWAKSKQGTIYY
jgi:hypothetical protein